MTASTGKFSLQWVNSPEYKRPMNMARFNLRDALATHRDAGLTCGKLFLDQVHVQFRPSVEIQSTEYRVGDREALDWINETLQLYVRLTPGVRHVLYTSASHDGGEADPNTVTHPERSIVYTSALSASHATSGDGDDAYCKTYRPIRDLPVLEGASQVSEIQVDLLWPLLQGDPSRVAWWSVPDYRIIRVICEFSYTV